MHSAIQTRTEGRRGCGYRRKGGLYLVGGGTAVACGRMPAPVDRCPTCDHGIKPARGWTWVDVAALLRDAPGCGRARAVEVVAAVAHAAASKLGIDVDPAETNAAAEESYGCGDCPLRPGTEVRRVGLLWVQQGYPTSQSFQLEANHVGVSRRISQVPKELVLGETWVLLAHRQTVKADCDSCGGTGLREEAALEVDGVKSFCDECSSSGKVRRPGIFSAFVPREIEVIVDGTEPDEEIDALVKRGFVPVKVAERDGPAVETAGAWVDHVERES